MMLEHRNRFWLAILSLWALRCLFFFGAGVAFATGFVLAFLVAWWALGTYGGWNDSQLRLVPSAYAMDDMRGRPGACTSPWTCGDHKEQPPPQRHGPCGDR